MIALLFIGIPAIVGVCGCLAEIISMMMAEDDRGCGLSVTDKYWVTFIVAYVFLLVFAEALNMFNYAQSS